jgi:hypothetical protein
VKYTADPDSKLPEITYWLMGSIAKVTWDDLADDEIERILTARDPA